MCNLSLFICAFCTKNIVLIANIPITYYNLFMSVTITVGGSSFNRGTVTL